MITLLNTVMCVVHIVHLGIPQPSLASTTPLVINVHFSNCELRSEMEASVPSEALSQTLCPIPSQPFSLKLSQTISQRLSQCSLYLSFYLIVRAPPSKFLRYCSRRVSFSGTLIVPVWSSLYGSNSSNPGANKAPPILVRTPGSVHSLVTVEATEPPNR